MWPWCLWNQLKLWACATQSSSRARFSSPWTQAIESLSQKEHTFLCCYPCRYPVQHSDGDRCRGIPACSCQFINLSDSWPVRSPLYQFPFLHCVPDIVWDFVKCPIQLWWAVYGSESQSLETPRMFSKCTYHPRDSSPLSHGNSWGWGLVKNHGARRNVTEEYHSPEWQGGRLKAWELLATVSPEESSITWQDLLPMNPGPILAISILSQGLQPSVEKFFLEFEMPMSSPGSYGFLSLFFAK